MSHSETVESSLPLHYKPNFSAALLEVLTSMTIFFLMFRGATAIFTRPSFLHRYGISPAAGLEIAWESVSATIAAAASVAGIYLMSSSASRDGMAHTFPHPGLEHGLLISIAYFLYDLYPMYSVFASKSSEESTALSSHINCRTLAAFWRAQSLLIVHHLAFGVFIAPMMLLQLEHEPGEVLLGAALILETSTPFVSMRAILSLLNLKRSRLYLINGLFMIVVFFCSRILVFPVLYCVYARQRDIAVWAALTGTPKKCLVGLAVVLAVQIYWFQVIVKGALKMLKIGRGEKNCHTKSE